MSHCLWAITWQRVIVATTLVREMEMTWWLEQAEALGKTLEVG